MDFSSMKGHKRKINGIVFTEENVKKSRKSEENSVEQELNLRTQQSEGVPHLTLTCDNIQEPIRRHQLTELILFASLGMKQPSWCHLDNHKNVSGVNITVLEGLGEVHFYKYYLRFKNLRKRYRTRCSFLSSPGASPLLSDILNTAHGFSEDAAPVLVGSDSGPNNNFEHQEGHLRWHPIFNKYGTKTRGLTRYLLSIEEMGKKAFPLPGDPRYESFVCTESDERVTDSSPLYGLDCEMCVTECGNELARVSLVDSEGCCLLDELVKPERRILDYCTRYSGITKAMLKPVTTRLKDIQAKLREILPRDAVLVGHSLDSDLRALNMIHPHVIDTSLLYRGECGQRFKLKFLAEFVLKKIQCDGQHGHDPTEDALAALQLAQVFISSGPRKIVELNLDGIWRGDVTGKETPLNGSIHSANPPQRKLRFHDALRNAGRSVIHFTRESGINAAQATKQLTCSSDREVLSSFQREAPSCFFSLVEFSLFVEKTKTLFNNKKCDQLHQKMLTWQREMCTVYVGPLPKDCSEKSVRKLLRRCGPIHSLRLTNTTQRTHAVIVFKLLEGAFLAVNSLHGIMLDGCSIKVQRPVKESTLDLDVYLGELERDLLEDNFIYVSGVSEKNLPKIFGQYGSIERVVLPQKPTLGKLRKNAFIKYQNAESVVAALSSSSKSSRGKMKVCKALTPPHLSSWSDPTCQSVECSLGEDATESEEHCSPQQHFCDSQMKDLMRKLDRKVGKLFKALPDKALSIILLPGHTRISGLLPGLCLIGVKNVTST